MPCEGGSIILVGTTDLIGAYLWSGPNGFSSTDQSPAIVEAGLYTLVVMGQNGCEGRDLFLVDRDECGDCEPLISSCPSDFTVQCAEDFSPEGAGGSPIFRSNGSDEDKKCPAIKSQGWYDEVLSACPYVIRRTFYAVAEDGEMASCIQMINVIDVVAPIFENVPSSGSILACDANMDDLELPAIWAYDECTKSVVPAVLSVETVVGDCPSEYTLVHTWTAMDDCGNIASVQWTVMVVDNEAPLITCIFEDLKVDCKDIPELAACSAVDNCDPDVKVIYSEEIGEGDCEKGYIIKRSWIALDACGNSSEQHQTIVVNGKKTDEIGKDDGTNEKANERAAMIQVHVAPNPFREQSTITFLAKEDGKATVTISDPQGRRITDAFSGGVKAGEPVRVVFTPVENGSGIYLYNVQLNGETVRGRLIYQP